MARFYLATIQAVLLYGTDSWVVSHRSMQELDNFHKRAVQHMTGKDIRKVASGEWHYPDHNALLHCCALWPMSVSIQRRRGTLREYMEKHKSELLEEVQTLLPPARHPDFVVATTMDNVVAYARDDPKRILGNG